MYRPGHPLAMVSLWTHQDDASSPEAASPPPRVGGRYDDVVIGGGLTGLTTALLLARAGRRIALLEARHLGAGATGSTTGKVSLLQGTRLSSIARHHGAGTLRDYVEANRAGSEWLLRYCAQRDLPSERGTAVTYARSDTGAQAVDHEYEACRSVGLDVFRGDCPALPFSVQNAIHLTDQAQIDPMPILRALAEDVTRHGGSIVEGVRVHAVSAFGDSHQIRTDAGTLSAGTVVVATGAPILDRGGFFARLSPHRSYAAAFRVAGPIPGDMYLSADEPTVSLRTAPRPGRAEETLLLVGGFGHEVGRTKSERAHVDALLEWTRRQFPSAELVTRWSAQDYESVDELPYVGPLLPGAESLQVATGFAKWGMTNGVAAALALAGRILGDPQPWAHSLRPSRYSQFASAASAARINAKVGLQLAAGYTRLVSVVDPHPAEGAGSVGRDGLRPVGACTVDGQTSTVAPVCTHLFGALNWNDAERTWDCPLHGSRFDHQGAVLEGPATRPLKSW